MLAHEVIREAIRLIRAGGLSKGAAARDAAGNAIPLFGGTRDATKSQDDSRATINGAAVSLSMYGALATVMNRNACNPSAIWPPLRVAAAEAILGKARPGGTNALHPVMALNELETTTTETACAFLEGVAAKLEPANAE